MHPRPGYGGAGRSIVRAGCRASLRFRVRRGVARPPCDGSPRRQRAQHRMRYGRRRKWKVHRSEEHTSELQSLMRISYAVFCLKKKKKKTTNRKIYELKTTNR